MPSCLPVSLVKQTLATKIDRPRSLNLCRLRGCKVRPRRGRSYVGGRQMASHSGLPPTVSNLFLRSHCMACLCSLGNNVRHEPQSENHRHRNPGALVSIRSIRSIGLPSRTRGAGEHAARPSRGDTPCTFRVPQGVRPLARSTCRRLVARGTFCCSRADRKGRATPWTGTGAAGRRSTARCPIRRRATSCKRRQRDRRTPCSRIRMRHCCQARSVRLLRSKIRACCTPDCGTRDRIALVCRPCQAVRQTNGSWILNTLHPRRGRTRRPRGSSAPEPCKT
jgi:hypothetical protein